MTRRERPEPELLSTGIPGVDEVDGGGLPEYSFSLIAGVPGTGKTAFAHQLRLANATAAHPAIDFTIVGAAAVAMLRCQQQMASFDPAEVGTAIRFVDLSAEVLGGGRDLVLAKMTARVLATNPAFVTVDSFRTLVRARIAPGPQVEPQQFLQTLALHLTTWQVTALLVGECGASELETTLVLTMGDSFLLLSQSRERNSVVRRLEVKKMRGVASIPEGHTFGMSENGIQVVPRTTFPGHRPKQPLARADGVRDSGAGRDARRRAPRRRRDDRRRPVGTGKTMLSTQLVAEGVRNGDGGGGTVFEEQVDDYLHRAGQIGVELQSMATNQRRVMHLRPLDRSADELVFEIRRAVEEIGTERLGIDSLDGLEVALAPTFREDFRESLYRMVGRLTGVSAVFTIELAEAFDEILFSPHAVSLLAQDVLFLRSIEIEGELRKMLTIVELRRSAHRRQLREYERRATGVQMRQVRRDCAGVLTGIPIPRTLPSVPVEVPEGHPR